MDLFLGVVLILVMVVSSGVAVTVFEKIVHEIKVSKLLLATILIGFSTSLPELFVGIGSAIRQQPQLALGDLLGANIANMSWIIGGAAVMSGTIPVVGEYLRRDLWFTLSAGIIPFLLMIDGKLGRFDGLILILFYLWYVSNIVKKHGQPLRHVHMSGKIHPVHHRLKTEVHWMVQMIYLILALGVLGVSSWMLINMAINIVNTLHVSLFWVGLIVISLGTTLPELVVSYSASRKKEMALVLGNVFGSVTVNSTLILGIIALIHPIVYDETLQRNVAGLFLLLILGTFWLFTKSKHKLDRWEGTVLIGLYIMFIGIQILIT